jgi:hypothetical protein
MLKRNALIACGMVVVFIFSYQLYYYLNLPPKVFIAAHIALRRIQSIARSEGRTYAQFKEAVGGAQADIDLFLESPEAERYSGIASTVRKAMQGYKEALACWSQLLTLSSNDPEVDKLKFRRSEHFAAANRAVDVVGIYRDKDFSR